MLLVPAGSFERTPAGGGPRQTIVVPSPFYLGKYEVRWEEWDRVMEVPPDKAGPAPRLPVTFDRGVDHERFLERTGLRLPTEAEWERACRLGGASVETAWHRDNSFGDTRPVGWRAPDALGFHDLLGNVAELCTEPIAHPDGFGVAGRHVLKGRCYRHDPLCLAPEDQDSLLREDERAGLRVARSP
jgi:formylglycine-generating enzyme required for sulfatase activity